MYNFASCKPYTIYFYNFKNALRGLQPFFRFKFMDIIPTIHAWLIPLLGEEHFAVDVQFVPRKPLAKLLISLDGDKGVGIDICASISRQLSALIDEADLIPIAYTLEVGSPGADSPLLLPRQYQQHVGRNIKVELIEGETLQGKIMEVHPEYFLLETAGIKKKTFDTHEVYFTNIKKASIVVAI